MNVRFTILLVVAGLLLPTFVDAATIAASTCSATDVQAAINASSTGDTVTIPSGSCDWGTTMVTINSKNIIVQGAGQGTTNISGSWTLGNAAFRVGFDGVNNATRITALSIAVPNGSSGIQIDGAGWRIDHVSIASNPSGALCDGVWAYGGHVAGLPYGPTGLIDHMAFTDCRVIVFGWPDVPWSSGQIWSSALGLGDANAVYVEDSTYTWTANFDDLQDCNYGGRIVNRFNAFSGGGEIHAHSSQGWRGCRRWETYNNTVSTNFSSAALWYRGGTGVVFGNSFAYTGGGASAIIVDNVRSGSDAMNRPPIGTCDGTSNADGNVGGVTKPGWPCRDQIGWNTDSFQWTAQNTVPTQAHEPAYFVANTNSGSTITINNTNGNGFNALSPNYLQPNIDYYESSTMTVQTSTTSPFNGTSGVGFGSLANRPSTCTTYGDGSGSGVGYWATDQGTWNQSGSNPQGVNVNGADGVLYRCSATNTWTLYYTPYTYPHPLQGFVAAEVTGAGIKGSKGLGLF